MKLDNGMVCTLRNGNVLTVVYGFMFDGFPYNVLTDGKKNPSIFVEDYQDDLTMRRDCELLGTEHDKAVHGDEYDIMTVEMNGKVIWDRQSSSGDKLFVCPKPDRPTEEKLEGWFPELKN